MPMTRFPQSVNVYSFGEVVDNVTKIVDGRTAGSAVAMACKITSVSRGSSQMTDLMLNLRNPHIMYLPITQDANIKEMDWVKFGTRIFRVVGKAVYPVFATTAAVECVLEEVEVDGAGDPT